ncbi:unnamed protein product [Heterobilharzia americana]|nr:unnamed protein product [Heterobilharzia americana]
MFVNEELLKMFSDFLFEKSFLPDNIMSTRTDILYEKIVECIKKPIAERSIEEIEEIYQWFIEKVDFFSNLQPDVVKDIIKNCEFSEREADDIIIRQSEEGECNQHVFL